MDIDMIGNIPLLFEKYGEFIYLIIFLIILGEVAVFFGGILPGDSLVFAAGAMAATDKLNIFYLVFIIPLASIIGNCLNYFTGLLIDKKLIRKFNGKILNKENIAKTHNFYQKYGVAAVIISRFLPLMRNLTPFIAGVSEMNFWKFLICNIIGSFLWGIGFMFSGFFLGNIPLLKEKIWLLTILIALFPMVILILTYIIRKVISKNKRGE